MNDMLWKEYEKAGTVALRCFIHSFYIGTAHTATKERTGWAFAGALSALVVFIASDNDGGQDSGCPHTPHR
jgi:hypothetical protein